VSARDNVRIHGFRGGGQKDVQGGAGCGKLFVSYRFALSEQALRVGP
jgi:hypothetical protein